MCDTQIELIKKRPNRVRDEKREKEIERERDRWRERERDEERERERERGRERARERERKCKYSPSALPVTPFFTVRGVVRCSPSFSFSSINRKKQV